MSPDALKSEMTVYRREHHRYITAQSADVRLSHMIEIVPDSIATDREAMHPEKQKSVEERLVELYTKAASSKQPAALVAADKPKTKPGEDRKASPEEVGAKASADARGVGVRKLRNNFIDGMYKGPLATQTCYARKGRGEGAMASSWQVQESSPLQGGSSPRQEEKPKTEKSKKNRTQKNNTQKKHTRKKKKKRKRSPITNSVSSSSASTQQSS